MSQNPTSPFHPRAYKDHVTDDPALADAYAEYQAKYAEQPRESDKRTAQMVLQSLSAMQPLDHRPRILDIGCSTGNFLRHLKRLNIEADLAGGDLRAPHIDRCRQDPALAGISFDVMDVTDLPADRPFDIITANAVNVFFDNDRYGFAMQSIARALRPGGYFIGFEWTHRDAVDLQINEKSEWFPGGVEFWFRSAGATTRALKEAGFDAVAIEPFDIPIDLPKPIPGSFEDRNLVTYTIRTDAGRMQMRGSINQPWAHIVARKG